MSDENTAKQTLQELKKRLEGKSLLITTPCYGGVVHANFSKCIAETLALGMNLGVKVGLSQISNESLVQRARNYLLDEFWRSNYTHQLWVDADISWSDPFAPFILLAMCDEVDTETNKRMDIVAAVYPKKNLNALKMVEAVKAGLCDENPNDIFKYGADLAFNLMPGTKKIDINRFVEVQETSTGFMMYSKNTLEKMRIKYSKTLYKPDHVGTDNFDGSKMIYSLFDCEIDSDTKRYLSEDYLFVKRARKIGLNCFVAPFIELSHTGTYTFRGSLRDVAVLSKKITDYQINPSGPLVKIEKGE